MWFWLSIATLIFWSGSDIFSKIGCADGKDSYSHLKMIMAVGAVMGIHAAYSLIFDHVLLDFDIILTYLPISLLYILSMLLGYIGLRYIELSVSSPICNSSGAVVAVLCLATGTLDLGAEGSMRILLIGAVALICLGVVGLGIVESVEDDELRMQRQKSSNFKYTKSWKAVCLPIAYCLLDAAGTFSDGIVLTKINEDSANCAYECTFFFAALLAFVYVVLIKKQKFLPKAEAPKYIGALFETLGQFTYIHALSNEETVALSAPIISSYCALSAVWGHIFLKERLSKKHYIMIALVLIGIILLGIFDI